MSVKNKIKYWLYFPLTLPLVFVYLFFKRDIVNKDIDSWLKYRPKAGRNRLEAFIWLIIFQKDFRTQFYFREGVWKYILNIFMKSYSDFRIEPDCKIGEGFVLMHAMGDVFNGGVIIGKNFYCLHNVTIGINRGGVPVIGNNVKVGTGAIIIGGIHIGNNVQIGAGAIVTHDVPDNCTVLGPSAKNFINHEYSNS